MTAYNIEFDSSHNILFTRRASLILITIIILREEHKKAITVMALALNNKLFMELIRLLQVLAVIQTNPQLNHSLQLEILALLHLY
jgi:hypothetical protein